MKYELVARIRQAISLRMILYKIAVEDRYEMAPIINIIHGWLFILAGGSLQRIILA